MRWFALLVAVVALAGCGSDDPPSGPARSIPIGLAANVDGGPDVSAEIEAVKRTGARWLREDLEWSAAEPARGSFDWTRFDTIMRESAERKINVLPILDSAPCWAARAGTPTADCDKTLPADNADFARFASAAVARYGPGGSFWDAHPRLDDGLAIKTWEVWNEPYLASGALPVSAARYSSLFAAAADAGHARDPGSRWLFAAAASARREDGTDFDWLAAAADAAPQVAAKVGALAIHVYPQADDVESLNATRGSQAVINHFKTEFGVSRPAWITELGFAACDPATGSSPCVPGDTRAQREATKAEMLGAAIDQFRRTTFADAVFVYTLREYDIPFHGEVGLIGTNGKPLPVYTIFQRAATNG